jgi:hypothetical protein
LCVCKYYRIISNFLKSFLYVFTGLCFHLILGTTYEFQNRPSGEEVKRRNLAAELKHSQSFTRRHNTTEREDKVVCP